MLTLVGDPHAKPTNLDHINTLFDMADDLGHTVVWLGDLLDTKEVVRGKCLNTYYHRFKDSKLKHYVLTGNHDWFNLECKEHALEALKALPNVIVVDKPTQHGDWSFFPYTHDVAEFRDWLKTHTSSSTRLFCHADIKSFDYGNGRLSEEGLDLEELKTLKHVISGHYHKFQEVGNVTYLGTPFSHSFGESNQEKYIGVYDVAEDRLQLIPTPFPAHVTLEIDAGKHRTHEKNEIDIYRVILAGTQEQIDKFQRLEGVRYIEQDTTETHTSVVSEIDTPQEQFQKWAFEIKGFSKDLIKRGLEILSDV